MSRNHAHKLWVKYWPTHKGFFFFFFLDWQSYRVTGHNNKRKKNLLCSIIQDILKMLLLLQGKAFFVYLPPLVLFFLLLMDTSPLNLGGGVIWLGCTFWRILKNRNWNWAEHALMTLQGCSKIFVLSFMSFITDYQALDKQVALAVEDNKKTMMNSTGQSSWICSNSSKKKHKYASRDAFNSELLNWLRIFIDILITVKRLCEHKNLLPNAFKWAVENWQIKTLTFIQKVYERNVNSSSLRFQP